MGAPARATATSPWYEPTLTPIEWTAAALNVLAVWLVARQKIANFPIGIVGVALYAVVFWRQHLYAWSVLQLFFLALQAWGWWEWLHGGEAGGELLVRGVKGREALFLGAAGGAATLALGAFLSRGTDNPAPWWDAANFAFSLVAQGMLARKVVENWALWVVLDVVTVGVSIRLALYPTAGLYAILTVIASFGWRGWRRDLAARCAASAAASSTP